MGPGTEIKRMALVIGNSAYTGAAPLKNPVNDAVAVGKKLIDIGFEVRTETDVTAEKMLRVLSDFTQALSAAGADGRATAAVVFYAGHGVQVDGENYLLPVDSVIRNKLDLLHSAVGLQIALETLSSVTKTCVVLLDCCRDNPLPRTFGGGTRSASAAHGLANVQAPPGVYIAFSTQPHFVAVDGAGDNSPFTEGLVQFMGQPGKHVADVIMDVRRVVYDKTGGQQVPWDHSALFEPFRFVAPHTRLEGLSDEQRQSVLQQEAEAREASYWQVVQNSADVAFIHSFVTQFPNSQYRARALARIDDLKAQTQFRRMARLFGIGLFLVIAGWLSSLWFLSKTLPDTNIAMGDIVNPDDGEPGFEGSLLACRLRCVFDRYDKPCVAFSYDKSTPAAAQVSVPDDKAKAATGSAAVGRELQVGMRRCFPKYAADYYWNPSETLSEPVDSVIMPTFFAKPPQPKKSPYRMNWYRTLAGESVDLADMLSKGDVDYKNDPKTGRTSWALDAGECQQTCIELGDKCRGFSYTSIANRCELFKSVSGVMRDQASGKPVYMPATISACDDPKAAIDPVTKESDCPPRNSLLQLAPSRSPNAGSASGPAKQ